MAIWDPLKDSLRVFKHLSPQGMKRLANQRLSETVLGEVGRSRKRIAELERRYPSANPRELSQHVIEHKKHLASMVGGISGVFGLASIPADLLVMAWLQVMLLVDVATLHKVNLKSERGRAELLEVLGHANGIGNLQRAGPKLLGKVAGTLFEKTGWSVLGRAMPLVAAPVTAYLNNQHIQRVGEEALRFYGGFDKAREKNKGREEQSV